MAFIGSPPPVRWSKEGKLQFLQRRLNRTKQESEFYWEDIPTEK